MAGEAIARITAPPGASKSRHAISGTIASGSWTWWTCGRRPTATTCFRDHLKHYPYVANSDFHKPKHMYSWKTLVRCAKNWDAIARTLRENVDVALTLYRNGSWAA